MTERMTIDEKLALPQSKGGYAIEVKLGYARQMFKVLGDTLDALTQDALEIEGELVSSQEVSEELSRELYFTKNQLDMFKEKENTNG